MTPEAVVALLGLQPHPEGGHFREVFRDAASTAIYFLLKAGERSHWHRVDAAEAWHHYAGGPLELMVSPDGRTAIRQVLGQDLMAGERPFALVPPLAWQAARPLGGWTLVGCTVAPPFRFAGFELAPPGWEPR
ncbi:MAG: cupin domain-containing protein [Magnetospirillum sp. WYHS-4]